MTVYIYRGPYQQSYGQFLHPEQPGVLVVEPGEMVEFGDGLPPQDGQWYDSDGNAVLPVEDVEQAGPGQQEAVSGTEDVQPPDNEE